MRARRVFRVFRSDVTYPVSEFRLVSRKDSETSCTIPCAYPPECALLHFGRPRNTYASYLVLRQACARERVAERYRGSREDTSISLHVAPTSTVARAFTVRYRTSLSHRALSRVKHQKATARTQARTTARTDHRTAPSKGREREGGGSSTDLTGHTACTAGRCQPLSIAANANAASGGRVKRSLGSPRVVRHACARTPIAVLRGFSLTGDASERASSASRSTVGWMFASKPSTGYLYPTSSPPVADRRNVT